MYSQEPHSTGEQEGKNDIIQQPKRIQPVDLSLSQLREIANDHKDLVSDITWLEKDKYLNDNILNFYLEYLKIRYSTAGNGLEHIGIMSTFFYSNLCKKTNRQDIHKMILRRQEELSKDIVIFPVHLDVQEHWVTCWLVRDLQKDGKCYQAILYLDSLSQDELVVDESTKRKILEVLSSTGDAVRMEFIDVTSPQQMNGSDWGLFVLQFVENILQDPTIWTRAANGEDVEGDLKETELKRQEIIELIESI